MTSRRLWLCCVSRTTRASCPQQFEISVPQTRGASHNFTRESGMKLRKENTTFPQRSIQSYTTPVLFTAIQILQYSDAMLHYSKPVNTVVRNCHPVMPHALQVCEIWALTRLGKSYEGLYCMAFTCHLVKSFFCLYITKHHAPRTFVLPECVLK